MYTAGLFFAYLCLAGLIAAVVWALFISAAVTWGRVDARLFMLRRQLLMCRRIHTDHGKSWGAAWADAGLIRRNTIRILAELQAENVGLTVEQIEFRDEVELDLWRLPTVGEVA